MSSVSSAMRARFSCGHELQRAHVVQPVGELDQQHAGVVGDGEQQLAEILGLLGVLGDEVELAELGQAVDQPADLLAERLVDLLAGDRRCPRSCRAASPPTMVASSTLSSVRMAATSSGCEKYGSPEARFWLPCAFIANT